MNSNSIPRNEAVYSAIHTPIDATVEGSGSARSLVLARDYSQGVEVLWRMLTDPAELTKWSPVVPDRVLDRTGPASCAENMGDEPLNAEVLEVHAPHRLVHRWGDDLLTWTLAKVEEGTRLELRQVLALPEHTSLYAAGWQVCFGALAVASAGEAGVRVVGDRAWDYGFQALYDAHLADLPAD